MADQQWIIDLKLQNEEAKKKAEELGERLEQIDEEPVEVTADTDQAQEEVRKVGTESEKTRGLVGQLVRKFEELTGIDLGPLGDVIAKLPGSLLAVAAGVGGVIGLVTKLRREQEAYNKLVDEAAEKWEGVFKEQTGQEAALEFVSQFTDELRTLGRDGVTASEALDLVIAGQGDLSERSVEAAGAIVVMSEAFERTRRTQDYIERISGRLTDEFVAMGFAAEEAGELSEEAFNKLPVSLQAAIDKVDEVGPAAEESFGEAESAVDRFLAKLDVKQAVNDFKTEIIEAMAQVQEGTALTEEQVLSLAEGFVTTTTAATDLEGEYVVEIADNFIESKGDLDLLSGALFALDGKVFSATVVTNYIDNFRRTGNPYGVSSGASRPRPTYTPPSGVPRNAPTIVTQVTGSQLERTLDNWARVNGYS